MGHVIHTVKKFVTTINPSMVIAAAIISGGFYAGMGLLADIKPDNTTLIVQNGKELKWFKVEDGRIIEMKGR